MSNTIVNMSIIRNSSANIADYCETALNIAEKLHDEYFFPIPANFNEDMLSTQLDKIICSYDYLAFAVAILRDALSHIESEDAKIAVESTKTERFALEVG